MKTRLVVVGIMLTGLMLLMAGCGGGGDGGEPAPTTGTVQISVQLPAGAAQMLTEQAPTVSRVEVIVTGADMTQMKRELTWNANTDSASGTLTVAAGTNRTFTVNIYDDTDALVYTGTATSNVAAGQTTTVQVTIYRVTGGADIIAGMGTIVFHSNRDGEFFDVYVANPDGSGVTNITNNPADDHNADWSPDGTKICFASDRNEAVGVTRLWTMNADGSNLTRLTDVWQWNCRPEWSPDGSRIVFDASPQPEYVGNREVFIINADGTNLTRLTDSEANIDDGSPSWSPDGSKIVYFRGLASQWQLWTMNPDGSGKTKITNFAGACSFPFWSPDGSLIAFRGWTGGNADVYTCRPDGTDVRRLTTHSSKDRPCGWSPDGRMLRFTSERLGTFDIGMMKRDGSDIQPVITGPRDDLEADWTAY